jgi:hypothetical protein
MTPEFWVTIIRGIIAIAPPKFHIKQQRWWEVAYTEILLCQLIKHEIEDEGWFITSECIPERHQVRLFAVDPQGQKHNLYRLAGLSK